MFSAPISHVIPALVNNCMSLPYSANSFNYSTYVYKVVLYVLLSVFTILLLKLVNVFLWQGYRTKLFYLFTRSTICVWVFLLVHFHVVAESEFLRESTFFPSSHFSIKLEFDSNSLMMSSKHGRIAGFSFLCNGSHGKHVLFHWLVQSVYVIVTSSVCSCNNFGIVHFCQIHQHLSMIEYIPLGHPGGGGRV